MFQTCRIAPKWLLNPEDEEEKKNARVLIAKDALLWVRGMLLNAPLAKALSGYTYVEIEDDSDIPDTDELQQAYLKAPEVTVCALGALFVADILRNDQYSGLDTHLSIVARLGRAFDSRELDQIEDFFEDPAFEYGFNVAVLQRCTEAYLKAGIEKMQDLHKKAHEARCDGSVPMKEVDALVTLRDLALQEVRQDASLLRLEAILENIVHFGSFQPERGLAPRWEPNEEGL